MQPSLTDADRIISRLHELATYSDAPKAAVTRVLFTDADTQARAFIRRLFDQAGLAVREDPAGNMFARWEASNPALSAVATGSHIDAIPYSGRYDGTLGVLGALEAVLYLKASGFQPRRSIEIVMFTSEEPTRFGMGCLGSRLMSGQMSPSSVAVLKDEQGMTFDEARHRAGYTGCLEEARLPDNHYRAFVELHIEQGPILEREQIPIGVVTAIAAPASLRVVYYGQGGHAGAVLMSERNDSLLAGSELAIQVERAALDLGGDDTVATTGVLDVHPRAINSIPSRVHLEIDVRDIDVDRRDRVLAAIQVQAEAVGKCRGQRRKIETITVDPPALCSDDVTHAIRSACDSDGVACRDIVSRAYHDSSFMAMIAPTGMIFIPCRDGVSHRPEEHTSPEHIADGVRILAGTLARLSRL